MNVNQVLRDDTLKSSLSHTSGQQIASVYVTTRVQVDLLRFSSPIKYSSRGLSVTAVRVVHDVQLTTISRH